MKRAATTSLKGDALNLVIRADYRRAGRRLPVLAVPQMFPTSNWICRSVVNAAPPVVIAGNR